MICILVRMFIYYVCIDDVVVYVVFFSYGILFVKCDIILKLRFFLLILYFVLKI